MNSPKLCQDRNEVSTVGNNVKSAESDVKIAKHYVQSIINYPTVCVCVGLCVTELLPNEGSNLNK